MCARETLPLGGIAPLSDEPSSNVISYVAAFDAEIVNWTVPPPGGSDDTSALRLTVGAGFGVGVGFFVGLGVGFGVGAGVRVG